MRRALLAAVLALVAGAGDAADLAPARAPLAPERVEAAQPEPAARPTEAAGVTAVRPPARPQALPLPRSVRADAARPSNRAAASRGAEPICGDPRLAGARLPEIREGACGLDRPVRLTKVAGVALTRPVTVGCETAVTLAGWIERVARPAARARLAAELASVEPFAGYACRPVNNRPGGDLSLHAAGDAIDLGAFRLADGREIAVTDWRAGGARSAFLRDLWRGACGPFGTVLGPEGDAHHQDHLHLDVAERRQAYCR